ncbi:MAG: aminopeptidase P family protein, partial [Calditrichaeota bacterium]
MPDRLALLRAHLKQLKLDAFLITSLTHLRYLFSFSGSSGIALVTEDKCYLVTDNRYREQVKSEVKNVVPLIAVRSLFSPLKREKIIKPKMRLGFEAAHVTFDRFAQLHKTFPDNQLIDTENVLETIVLSKDADELEKTRRACQIACKVFPEVLPFIKDGVREHEIAAEIAYRFRLAGAEKEAFDIIVASGWRSALPHGIASDKIIRHGELIVIDFGCSYQGFNSDITRTIALG